MSFEPSMTYRNPMTTAISNAAINANKTTTQISSPEITSGSAGKMVMPDIITASQQSIFDL